MTERGTVTEIRDRELTVQLEMTAGCGNCANDGCKVSRHALKAYNRDGLELAEGDLVEIEVEGRAQVTGALWVLGLPLALFAGGYFAGRALFPTATGEGPAALSGLAGLVLGMVVGVWAQKGQRLDSLPRALRKVEARDPDELEIARAEEAAAAAGILP